MFMYCNGLMVLLGETIGIGNWNNIRRLPVITLQIVLGIFSVMALPGWLLRERVIGFITDLPDVSAQAVSIFWLVILTEASRPFYEIAKYSLQTIGGERKALILTGMINSVALVAIWVLPNQGSLSNGVVLIKSHFRKRFAFPFFVIK